MLPNPIFNILAFISRNTGAGDHSATLKTIYCMKIAWLLTLVSGLAFCSCNHHPATTTPKTTSKPADHLPPADNPKDKEEIQNLIRKTLKWAESKNAIDLLPTLAD